MNLLLWNKTLSLTLFKITLVSRPITLWGFSLLRDQHVPLREEIEGRSPCKPKSLKFTLLLISLPRKNGVPTFLPWSRIKYWKKASAIGFGEFYQKFYLRRRFSVTQSWFILKSLLELCISSTKQSGQILQKQDGHIKTVCSPGHPKYTKLFHCI